jgi:hypothetical protein
MSHVDDLVPGTSGKFLDERCDKCGLHATAFAKFARCGRCRLAKYCSEPCQKAAWVSHKPFCLSPSPAMVREQEEVRRRMRAGAGDLCRPTITHEILKRDFVLISGQRLEALSNNDPPFSIFNLPDAFEFMWPMHDLLSEVSQLGGSFCATTMGEFRDYMDKSDGLSDAMVRSVEGSLKKFVKNAPTLFEAMNKGHKEAAKSWGNGFDDMTLLLYERWRRGILKRIPMALLPLAPRPYELDGFVAPPRRAARGGDRAASVRSVVDSASAMITSATSGAHARFFILWMPEDPFEARAAMRKLERRVPVKLASGAAAALPAPAAAPAPAATAPGCSQCGTTGGKLLACTRCRAASYCSIACQRLHYPSHVAGCRAAAAVGC